MVATYPSPKVLQTHQCPSLDTNNGGPRRTGGKHGKFKSDPLAETCSGSKSGSYLRLIDSCITQLKAHGPFKTCDESKEEEAAIRFEKAATPKIQKLLSLVLYLVPLHLLSLWLEYSSD